MVNWENNDLKDALIVGFWNTFKDQFTQETKDQIMAIAQKREPTINWNNFRNQRVKMVNWDNAALALRIVTYLWNNSKEKFTPEFKEDMILELRKVDATITWEALRLPALPCTRNSHLQTSAAPSSIMSTRKTMAWTAQVHEDILVALLTVAKITPQQLSEAMKALTAQGYSFTESALNPILLFIMPAVNGPATAWDDKAHFDLLIEVLKVAKPTNQQWADIISGVTAKGYNYSSSAAQQHIAKLQKKESSGAVTPAKSTPVKKTPVSKRKATPKKAASVPSADDDDEEMETPSKKPKIQADIEDEIKHPSAAAMGEVDEYQV
ncbi:hypothetical protein ACHAQA_007413 [Verticillium albo-atrum]